MFFDLDDAGTDVGAMIRNAFKIGENIQKGIILDFIYLAQDILNLGVFLLVAILICLKYKPTSKAN